MKFSALFLSSILYFLSSVSMVQNVSAQSNVQTKEQIPHLAPNTNPDVPKNLHTYTQNVIIEIMSAFSCQLTGIDPVNPNQQCLGVDPNTGKIGFVPASKPGETGGGGAIGVMGKMISILYNPPLHTGDYFNYLAQNFGIAKPTYAKGTGFEGLKPLLGLWTAFRNIVYLIFTIVFVVIGFAIMFRIKIDPRTVMTIQNQIPKIIVGIVLVTFSYAIAGFLIDMMWVSIHLFFGVFSGIPGVDVANLNPSDLQGKSPFQAAGGFGGLFTIPHTIALSAKDFISNLLNLNTSAVRTFNPAQLFESLATQDSIADLIVDLISLYTASVVGGMIANISNVSILGTNLTGAPAGLAAAGATYSAMESTLRIVIPYLIIYIVVSIALIWSLFRLWFILIYSYIYILIDVVLAPFWIAGGLIPGQAITFGGWLRHIVSFIAAFPTTIGLFLLGKVFIGAFKTQDPNSFLPPLIGGTGDPNLVSSLISLGIILLSSNVVNMTQKSFNAPRIDIGRMMQAIGVGTGVAGSPITAVKQLGTGAFSLAMSRRLEARLPKWLGGAGGGGGGGGGG